MKTFLIIAIAVGMAMALWYFVPIAVSTINCYDTGQTSADEIQFRARAAGWEKRAICEAGFDRVLTLSECLQKTRSQKSKLVMHYLEPYIAKVFHLVRPFLKEYEQQKIDYNAECQEFEDILIE